MKRARLALLTAAIVCSIGPAAPPALAAGAAALWSDLWRTPDQQGQALLDAGEPAAAAARFRDPRRRAYADLQAGRNAQAAKLLAPFTDVASEYNRGNALARSGQLQAALAAYDAALKQAPRDADIRHNRDLVERALRHQPPSAQSSSGHGGQRSPSSGQQRQSSGGGQSRSNSNGGARTASNGSQSGAGHSGNSGQPQPGAPQAAGDHGAGGSREPPGQARRDAAFAAAMARRRQHDGMGDGSGQPGARGAASRESPGGAGKQSGKSALVAGGTRTPPQKPESERQLALDQWLRQIPDSPAGLLRRKFLIEHMMRQQDGGDPQGGGQ